MGPVVKHSAGFVSHLAVNSHDIEVGDHFIYASMNQDLNQTSVYPGNDSFLRGSRNFSSLRILTKPRTYGHFWFLWPEHPD